MILFSWTQFTTLFEHVKQNHYNVKILRGMMYQ